MAKKSNQDITKTDSVKIITKEQQIEPEDSKNKTSQLKKMNDSEENETGAVTRFRGDLKKGLTNVDMPKHYFPI